MTRGKIMMGLLFSSLQPWKTETTFVESLPSLSDQSKCKKFEAVDVLLCCTANMKLTNVNINYKNHLILMTSVLKNDFCRWENMLLFPKHMSATG